MNKDKNSTQVNTEVLIPMNTGIRVLLLFMTGNTKRVITYPASIEDTVNLFIYPPSLTYYEDNIQSPTHTIHMKNHLMNTLRKDINPMPRIEPLTISRLKYLLHSYG
jgi:hypothetical protein